MLMTSCTRLLLYGVDIVTYARTIPNWFLIEATSGPTYMKRSVCKQYFYGSFLLTLTSIKIEIFRIWAIIATLSFFSEIPQNGGFNLSQSPQ